MRPVLEAAVVVARVGSRAHPPVPAPPGLRPYLGFRRLTGPALDAALNALDDDADFRRRVLATLEAVAAQEPDEDEDEDAGDLDANRADKAAALVLERPPGWKADLADLVAEVRAENDEADAVARAKRLDRDLERARAERDEAITTARDAVTARVAAEAEASAARDTAAIATRDLEMSHGEVSRLTDERQQAIRDLKATESRLAERQADLKAVRAELATREAELQALRAAATSDSQPTPKNLTDAATTDGSAPSPSDASVPIERADAAERAVERAQIADAVRRAAAAAAALTAALGDVARTVGGDPPGAAEPGLTSPSIGAAPRADRPAPVARPARRRPPPLPVGIFDDSAAAAEHYCRVPGVVLLVDGYNLSLAGWPALPLAEQRRRLLDALGTLSARTGCEPLVVFDGADVGAGLPGESRARGVQVRFTTPGIEADDDLLALVERYPVERAVVVASSDQRVIDGARARGAATLRAEQLLGSLKH